MQLQPRRQELLALLKSLNDETTSEGTTKGSESGGSPRIFRRWLVVAVLAFVSLVLLILASRLFGSSYDGPPQIDGPAVPHWEKWSPNSARRGILSASPRW